MTGQSQGPLSFMMQGLRCKKCGGTGGLRSSPSRRPPTSPPVPRTMHAGMLPSPASPASPAGRIPLFFQVLRCAAAAALAKQISLPSSPSRPSPEYTRKMRVAQSRLVGT